MSEMLNIYFENLELSIIKINKAKENIQISSPDLLNKYKLEGENSFNESNKIVS